MVFRPRWTSRAVRCWARAPGAAWWHRGTTGGTQRGIKMSDLVYLRRSRRPSISIGTGHKWLSRNLNGWPALFHALLCQPLHVLSDPGADSTTNQPRFANTEVAIYLESFFYSDSVCSLNPLIGYVKWVDIRHVWRMPTILSPRHIIHQLDGQRTEHHVSGQSMHEVSFSAVSCRQTIVRHLHPCHRFGSIAWYVIGV